MKWLCIVVAVAVMAGCSEPGRPYELPAGSQQLAAITGAGDTAELGDVKAGTLQVIIECTGGGTGQLLYGGKQLSAPCASGGEVSQTDIPIGETEKNVTLTLEGGEGVESMRALVGWTAASSSSG